MLPVLCVFRVGEFEDYVTDVEAVKCTVYLTTGKFESVSWFKNVLQLSLFRVFYAELAVALSIQATNHIYNGTVP